MKISHTTRKSCFTGFKFFICISVIFASSFSLQAQWISQNSGISSQLLSVYFINQNTGFTCGLYGQILKTTDSGVTWQANTVIDTSAAYCSFYFNNSNTGYAAGRILILGQNFSAKPLILKTTDSGGTWNSLLSDSGYTLWSINFINENTGYASGGLFALGTNKFLSTTNGGSSWQVSTFLEPGYLGSIMFQNINLGFTLSFQGYIYKSTNSGANWNILNHLPYYTLSVTFNDADIGFITGGNFSDSTGLIYKTIDSGNNWTTVYSDGLGTINSILFVNSNTGFAAGQREYTFGPVSARIIKTTNAGIDWYIDTLFSNIGGLGSLFFTDENTGYAVGSNGAIFKTTTGGNPVGVKNNTGEIPAAFSLYQNYPNPFNPSTKINYDLPFDINVKLVVYDAIGREVKTLVNEKQNAGTHEIVFDASNYPSGVYFYKLSTATFSQTNKMVLIK